MIETTEISVKRQKSTCKFWSDGFEELVFYFPIRLGLGEHSSYFCVNLSDHFYLTLSREIDAFHAIYHRKILMTLGFAQFYTEITKFNSLWCHSTNILCFAKQKKDGIWRSLQKFKKSYFSTKMSPLCLEQEKVHTVFP